MKFYLLEVVMLYGEYLDLIDEKKELFYSVSDAIWDHPETSFEEYYIKTIFYYTSK